MRKSVHLSDLKPNPFRNIKAYPFQEDKLEALQESIEQTGFWNNLVAREGEDDALEIAYGHHRLEALRRTYDAEHVINIEVRDLSDEQMLKIMARENMEEWGSSAMIEMETVRAVVEAFAAGRIQLEEPHGKDISKGKARIAPNFKPIREDFSTSENIQKYYTTGTVARFLGWTDKNGRAQMKVAYSLYALELIERGVLEQSDVADLTERQLREQVKEVRRAEKRKRKAAEHHKQRAKKAKKEAASAPTPEEREVAEAKAEHAEKTAEKYEQEAEQSARKVGKHLGEKMRKGEVAATKARQEAERIEKQEEEEQVAYAHQIVDEVCRTIARTLTHKRELRGKIDELERLKKRLTTNQRKRIADNLRAVANRANKLADKFHAEEDLETHANGELVTVD